jgi:hypothetical protein
MLKNLHSGINTTPCRSIDLLAIEKNKLTNQSSSTTANRFSNTPVRAWNLVLHLLQKWQSSTLN